VYVCVCCDSDKTGAMKNSSWKTFHSQLTLSKEKTVMFADNLEDGEISFAIEKNKIFR